MTFYRLAGARVCGTLAGLFLFTGLVYAQPAPLGVRISNDWRPGYHKILEVFDGSPAQAIGLEPGFVIVAIDGKIVGDPDKVRWDLRKKDQIWIIFHNGKELYEVVARLKEGKVYGSASPKPSGPQVERSDRPEEAPQRTQR